MSITRRNSHKPSSTLLAEFKKSFPSLVQKKASELPATPPTDTFDTFDTQSLAELMSFDPGQYRDSEDQGEQDKSFQDPGFGSSHSRTESGSLNYAAALLDFPTPTGWYQNQNQNQTAIGYYPSPGQFQWPNTFHQGMPTPYSRSMSLSSPDQPHQSGFLSLQDVQLRPPYQAAAMDYPTLNSFSPQQHASSTFRQTYDTPVNFAGLLPSQNTQMHPAPYPGQDSNSQFRFQTTLLNSTAMVRDNEIPVSYLNKRQLYKIAIVDSRPRARSHLPTTYRTYIRISFHEERQRAHPDQHWQLWKEGRGMNEAQQHGGALRAIEYVPLPSGPGHHPNVHVEKDSFDGFCVTWNAAPGLRPFCELQFRCNFLSTDFSRSKGVKGIPVRLCAKSEEVGFSSDSNPSSTTPEICYCKIKLFRDHGAERKLSNDEAAVRRAIKKSEDQLKEAAVAEEGIEEPVSFGSGNKRRAGDISPENKRPNKLARKVRAASVSSEGSSQGQVVGEGDATQKLASLNRLLRSRLEITSFSLQGLAADDPDLHPVTLKDSGLKATRDSSPELRRVSRTETGMTEQSAASSALTSNFSVSSPHLRQQTYLQVPTPMISQQNSEEWESACKQEQSADLSTANMQANASPQDERKFSTRISFGEGKSFHALDVDPSYRPPPLPVSRPVACFYVKPSFPGVSSPQNLYRACYLYERTVSELISVIAKKVNLNPLDIVHCSLIRQLGNHEIRVELDDDVVKQMSEGQDLRADFSPNNDEQSAAPPQYALTLR